MNLNKIFDILKDIVTDPKKELNMDRKNKSDTCNCIGGWAIAKYKPELAYGPDSAMIALEMGVFTSKGAQMGFYFFNHPMWEEEALRLYREDKRLEGLRFQINHLVNLFKCNTQEELKEFNDKMDSLIESMSLSGGKLSEFRPSIQRLPKLKLTNA